MNAVIYALYSSDNQREESIEEQIRQSIKALSGMVKASVIYCAGVEAGSFLEIGITVPTINTF